MTTSPRLRLLRSAAGPADCAGTTTFEYGFASTDVSADCVALDVRFVLTAQDASSPLVMARRAVLVTSGVISDLAGPILVRGVLQRLQDRGNEGVLPPALLAFFRTNTLTLSDLAALSEGGSGGPVNASSPISTENEKAALVALQASLVRVQASLFATMAAWVARGTLPLLPSGVAAPGVSACSSRGDGESAAEEDGSALWAAANAAHNASVADTACWLLDRSADLVTGKGEIPVARQLSEATRLIVHAHAGAVRAAAWGLRVVAEDLASLPQSQGRRRRQASKRA